MNSSDLHITLSETELAQALDNCAKEPIHLTDAIQPHGVLFVLSNPDMAILQASNNTTEFFGRAASSLIHKPINTLLGNHQEKALRNIITSGDLQPIKSIVLDVSHHNTKRRFDAAIHQSHNYLILEMEPTPLDDDASDLQNFYDHLRRFSVKLRQSTTLGVLYQTVVDEVRAITGFDRVKLYQFDEDWHGSVVSESRAEFMPSYLGLRFPASDIPEQARKLYSKSYLRLIADIHYEPVPLIPQDNPDSHGATDLSLSVLRSVSPVHLQYLDNMKVNASMSVSVIHNQRLWGLIACHHNEPKYVPYKVRMITELIGHIFSSHLFTLEETRRSEQQQRQKFLLAEIAAGITPEKTLEETLRTQSNLFYDVVDADGVMVLIGDDTYPFGETPGEKSLQTILDWLKTTHAQKYFTTSRLSEHVDIPGEDKATFAGLLAIPIDDDSRNHILWFRKEVIRHINWAGKPEKRIAMDSVGFRLTPRGSFTLWKETLQGTAHRWTDGNLQAAERVAEILAEKLKKHHK